jgi:hypothetical protein
MRKIIQLPSIPSDDQYHFRQRAQALVTKWQQLITTSEDNNGNGTKVGSSAAPKAASTSGKARSTSGKPKSVKADETKDEDAPAEPEANGVQANGSAAADAMEVDNKS